MKYLDHLFWKLFGYNLAAVYLSGIFWFPRLREAPTGLYIFSPVPVALLMFDSTSLAWPIIWLAGFVGFVGFLSVTCRADKNARVVIPIVLFFVFLGQGWVFLEILAGIDSIGG